MCQGQLTELCNSSHARVRPNQPPHTSQKYNPKDLAVFYFSLVSVSALNIYFFPSRFTLGTLDLGRKVLGRRRPAEQDLQSEDCAGMRVTWDILFGPGASLGEGEAPGRTWY